MSRVIWAIILLFSAIDARSLRNYEETSKFHQMRSSYLKDLSRKRRDVFAVDRFKDLASIGDVFNDYYDNAEILRLLLEKLADSELDITLVGWQRMFDLDGTLKEIRALELAIPPASTCCNSIEREEEEDFYIEMAGQGIKTVQALYVPSTVLNEYYVDDFVAQYYLEEGFTYQLIMDKRPQMNITISSSAVEDFISNFGKNKDGFSIILKFSNDGQLLLDQSSISDIGYLSHVIAYENIPDDILCESPKILGVAALDSDPMKIPQRLINAYNGKWPEYEWGVLENPEYQRSSEYPDKTVAITIEWYGFAYTNMEGVDRDPCPDVYYVYGNKKE